MSPKAPEPVRSRQLSLRLFVLIGVVCTGLIFGVLTGRPGLVVVVSPLAVLLITGTLLHRWPDLALTIEAPARCVEGDEIQLTMVVSSRTGIPWLHLDLELPPELEAVDGTSEALLELPPGRRVTTGIRVRATRWGVSSVGPMTVLARDRFGFFLASQVIRSGLRIRVHPHDGTRQAIISPSVLNRRVGTHISRTHGEGSEFAELRPWRTGDPARSINWRLSARRGERWTTVRHPDRSGDLVLLLDSFRDLGPVGDSMVQRGIRAALAVAQSNLAVHDRVGLLRVGRDVHWHRPGLGRLHSLRLMDALLETQVETGLHSPGINRLPLHELQGGALVVVVTGFLDDELSLLPLELRARGLEVVVIEVTAEGHLPATDGRGDLAHRLWVLQREALATQLRRGGITVVRWDYDQEIEVVVAAVARRGVSGAPRMARR